MPEKLERCVADVLSEKMKRYKKKYPNKTPSEKLQKKWKASAYAICNSVIKTEEVG